VEELTVKKEIACGEKGCGYSITVSSPDDEYTVLSVRPPKEGEKEGEDYIQRTGVCTAFHETPVYWRRHAKPILKTG